MSTSMRVINGNKIGNVSIDDSKGLNNPCFVHDSDSTSDTKSNIKLSNSYLTAAECKIKIFKSFFFFSFQIFMY